MLLHFRLSFILQSDIYLTIDIPGDIQIKSY